MPRTCAVFDCKSNCKVPGENGKQKNSAYIPCFPFPFIPEDTKNVKVSLQPSLTDSEQTIEKKLLTLKWVENLPNESSSLVISKNNGVCKLHFEDDCLKTFQKKTMLLPNSVPTKFTFDGKEIVTPLPPKRVRLDHISLLESEAFAKAIELSKETHKAENDIDTVQKIYDIIKCSDHDFVIKKLENFLYIGKLDFENSIIENYIKIFDDLSFTSSFKLSKKIDRIHNKTNLDFLLGHLSSEMDNSFCKATIETLAKKISAPGSENIMSIVLDQLNNMDLQKNQKRYQPSALLIYWKIFLYSPKTYSYLRENVMHMPHERNVRRVFSNLSVNVTNLTDNKIYLQHKI